MENEFGYIYVMDYCSCTISRIVLDEKDDEADDLEYSLQRRGVDIDEVEYMYSQNYIDSIDELEIEG